MWFFINEEFILLPCSAMFGNFLMFIMLLFKAMTMMFEVQDLAVASPATVSRCGMVYLEPGILGLDPFVDCYLKKLPDLIYPFKDQFKELFDNFMEVRLKLLK